MGDNKASVAPPISYQAKASGSKKEEQRPPNEVVKSHHQTPHAMPNVTPYVPAPNVIPQKVPAAAAAAAAAASLAKPIVKSNTNVSPGVGKKLASPPRSKRLTPPQSRTKRVTIHKNVEVADDVPSGDASTIAALERRPPVPSETEGSVSTAALMDVVGKVKAYASESEGSEANAAKAKLSARSKSKYSSLYGQEIENDPEKTEANKITAEEARRVRENLSRRQARAEFCTYHLLLVIAILRLLTTLLMVYEYEEYSMTLEYLLRLRKVNCIEVYRWVLIDLWPFILVLYFAACCILPTLTSKDVTRACIYWMVIQMVYTGYRFFFFQQYLFHREIFITKPSLIMFMGHTVLDILCFTIVMIRYYLWANPCLERDRYSNTMLGGYLVNEYILFMVQSSFIRKKTAVQRATAFQIMTVVRKLKDKYRSSGDGPSEQAIQKEVKSAIHALQDWKKFPALRIIHFFEVKEKIMKEKLKLRRQRIREMKNKFTELVNKHKRDRTRISKSKDKVVLNNQGQAIGLSSQKRAVDMADVVAMHMRNIKKEREQHNKAYANKRADLLGKKDKK